MIRRRRFGIGSGGIGIGSGSSGQQLGEKALLASEAAKERGRSRAGPLGGERGLELLSNVWVNIWCWVDGEEALLVCPYPILPIEIGNNALQRSEKGIWREIRNTLLNFSLETLMILTHKKQSVQTTFLRPFFSKKKSKILTFPTSLSKSHCLWAGLKCELVSKFIIKLNPVATNACRR